MPTNPNGALGSLDYTKEERRSLAIKSRETAPRYGTPERQKLINEIHEYMLSKAPPVPQATSLPALEEQITETEREIQGSPENPAAGAAEESLPSLSVAETTAEERRESASITNSEQTSKQLPAVQPSEQPVLRAPQQRVIRQTDDRIFTWAAIGLTIAIVVLILKKYMKANGHGAVFMDES